MYYYPKKPFQKVDYQPRIMREKLQISLWRFDAYGIVKIKDRYFTPKHEKFSRDSWPGFEPMTFSLDKEEIILVQKKSSTDREPLVLIIDAFSLEVKHELVVPTIDEEFEGGDGYYDHYYDDSSSAYPTKGDMPKVLVWNHCKYLMVPQTKAGYVTHIYYKIYNLEKKEGDPMHKLTKIEDLELITDFKREDKLRFMISDIKSDPTNPECLYMTLYKYPDMAIAKWNVIKGSVEVINEKGELYTSPKCFKLNDACDTVFMTFSVYLNYNSVYKLYSFGVREKPQMDPTNDTKGHKMIVPYSHTDKVDENYVAMYNDYQNRLGALSSGTVSYKRIANGNAVSQYYDVEDMGMIDNHTIACITHSGEEKILIETFPADKAKEQASHEIKEINFIKFNYPYVTIVKGCNEIMYYNILEKLYYYVKLNFPILLKCDVVDTANNTELK